MCSLPIQFLLLDTAVVKPVRAPNCRQKLDSSAEQYVNYILFCFTANDVNWLSSRRKWLEVMVVFTLIAFVLGWFCLSLWSLSCLFILRCFLSLWPAGIEWPNDGDPERKKMALMCESFGFVACGIFWQDINIHQPCSNGAFVLDASTDFCLQICRTFFFDASQFFLWSCARNTLQSNLDLFWQVWQMTRSWA